MLVLKLIHISKMGPGINIQQSLSHLQIVYKCFVKKLMTTQDYFCVSEKLLRGIFQ